MDKAKITEGKDIAKIILEFEDGTIKEIDKGMVISLEPKGADDMTMTIECCKIKQEDYQNTMYGLLSLASETYTEEY